SDLEKGVQRFCLNHEPLFLRGVLDQGYWPDGLMTAPSDEALRFDIEAMASLGFNMIRKHIKVESERWYYLCDRMGMLVWQDMVSGGEDPHVWIASRIPTTFKWFWSHYRDDTEKHQRHLSSNNALYRNEWQALVGSTVRRLKSHPCIITWSLFNEGWGQFDAAKATESVKSIDTTRPVDSTSGWFDQGCSDYNSVHNYFRDNEMFDDPFSLGRPLVVTEFGGLSFHIPEHSSWDTSFGYANFDAIEQWRKAVWGLLDQMDSLERKGLSGYVYTQLCDVEQETNGILTYDRRVNKLETVRLEDLHTDDEAKEARAAEEAEEGSGQTPAEELELEHADEETDDSPAQTDDKPAENGESSAESPVDDKTGVNNSTDESESLTPDEDQDADDNPSDDNEPDADGAEQPEDTEQAVEPKASEGSEATGDHEALPSDEEAGSSDKTARS
ncbi:MAG: glycoside hydrolase family 2 TIM barrel-domain containing protein, partial [Coriobacteriales bacterium]